MHCSRGQHLSIDIFGGKGEGGGAFFTLYELEFKIRFQQTPYACSLHAKDLLFQKSRC